MSCCSALGAQPSARQGSEGTDLVLCRQSFRSERRHRQSRKARGYSVRACAGYGLQLATFEGQAIAAEMPIVAINADEFEGQAGVIVESTIEPAVVAGSRIVSVGRVVAAAGGV